MIISDLYQTKIECVKNSDDSAYYNVDIDSTDVKVVVSLIDFNGNPVSGKEVVVTVDRGEFTSVETGTGGSITDSGKTATATTTSDGVIEVLYTASEWGLATFSTNSANIQINVTGWKKVKEGSNWSGVNYTLYVDEANRSATLVCNISNKDIASGMSNYEMTGWIPSQYRTHSQKFIKGYRGNNNVFYVFYDGRVGVANLTSSTQTNTSLGAQIDWNY